MSYEIFQKELDQLVGLFKVSQINFELALLAKRAYQERMDSANPINFTAQVYEQYDKLSDELRAKTKERIAAAQALQTFLEPLAQLTFYV